jgi:hypothetical protein
VGLALLVLVGLFEVGFLLYAHAFPIEDPTAPKPGTGPPPPPPDELSFLFAFVAVIGTTFLPAFLLLLGHSRRNTGLRLAAKSWLILVSVPFLGLGLLTLRQPPFEPVLIGLGVFTLLGAILLASAKPRPSM